MKNLIYIQQKLTELMICDTTHSTPVPRVLLGRISSILVNSGIKEVSVPFSENFSTREEVIDSFKNLTITNEDNTLAEGIIEPFNDALEHLKEKLDFNLIAREYAIILNGESFRYLAKDFIYLMNEELQDRDLELINIIKNYHISSDQLDSVKEFIKINKDYNIKTDNYTEDIHKLFLTMCSYGKHMLLFGDYFSSIERLVSTSHWRDTLWI